jgi:hypothetical protein
MTVMTATLAAAVAAVAAVATLAAAVAAAATPVEAAVEKALAVAVEVVDVEPTSKLKTPPPSRRSVASNRATCPKHNARNMRKLSSWRNGVGSETSVCNGARRYYSAILVYTSFLIFT